jgi:hypothetical protein
VGRRAGRRGGRARLGGGLVRVVTAGPGDGRVGEHVPVAEVFRGVRRTRLGGDLELQPGHALPERLLLGGEEHRLLFAGGQVTVQRQRSRRSGSRGG